MLQRRVYQLHAGNPGQRRPLPAPGYECFHCRLPAFSGNPYTAVGQVPDPTCYTKLVCYLFGAGPEKNALHLSFYSDLLMYSRHRFRFGSSCCSSISKLQTTRRNIKSTCWPYQVTIHNYLLLPAPCPAGSAQGKTLRAAAPAAILNGRQALLVTWY